jgi:hypothetical protein
MRGLDSSAAASRLSHLAERVRALDSAPVAAHPDVLEEVHRAIVGELESLAGAGSSSPPR